MGFNAPAGTRGARQPRAGVMMRWVNKMAARRIRRTGTMMAPQRARDRTGGAERPASQAGGVGIGADNLRERAAAPASRGRIRDQWTLASDFLLQSPAFPGG